MERTYRKTLGAQVIRRYGVTLAALADEAQCSVATAWRAVSGAGSFTRTADVIAAMERLTSKSGRLALRQAITAQQNGHATQEG